MYVSRSLGAILIAAMTSPLAATAAVPTEPPLTCVAETVVRTSVGPTIKTLAPGRRLVAVVWHLSDHHTYVSQTGDNGPNAPVAMKASDELRPAGAHVSVCSTPGDTSAFPYLIRTSDKTARAAKRVG